MLPLAVRKPLAAWMSRQRWMPNGDWWAIELIADWAIRDPNAYHRFCWAHHMGYAESYEVDQRFGDKNVHPSRQMLFDELLAFLRDRGIDPAKEIRSIFDVGCSMGYSLHHLERVVFPDAERLEGIDIDEYAIQEGAKYLKKIGSKVQISVADMGSMERALGHGKFDLILCAGVLMYLTTDEANNVVTAMLQHTSGYLVLAGLAHPEKDNKDLDRSSVREHDGSFIHNLDNMVHRAGGSILYRRWEGQLDVHGNTIYFLFCAPVPKPAPKVGAA